MKFRLAFQVPLEIEVVPEHGYN